MYSLKSFDKCLHLWNNHYNQDKKHSYHSQKFPGVPLNPFSSSLLTPPHQEATDKIFITIDQSVFLQSYINTTTQ